MSGTVGLPEVVVCLGTDHHTFERLVGWVEELAEEGWAHWFVQHGHTAPPGATLAVSASRLLGLGALTARMRAAGAVVTHGGPGLIVDAHLSGHRPVVVARDPGRGEHVDGHQQRFVAKVAGTGTITPVDDLDSFRAAVRGALATPRTETPLAGGPAGSGRAVARFGRFVDDLMQR